LAPDQNEFLPLLLYWKEEAYGFFRAPPNKRAIALKTKESNPGENHQNIIKNRKGGESDGSD